nr:EOG090X0J8E [Ilyocryptus agilis]
MDINNTDNIEANYCVKDAMIHGHPLQNVLLQHAKKEEEVNLKMLMKLQGLHMPLRLHMEKVAVKDIGHLPCLHRHNALLDALTGRDSTIDFEDFLNDPRDTEAKGQPHLVIEKHLGML